MSEEILQLKERVTHLEKELGALKAKLCKEEKTGWEQIVGSHKDDPTFHEFVKEMKRQRRVDDPRAPLGVRNLARKKSASAKRKKQAGAR